MNVIVGLIRHVMRKQHSVQCETRFRPSLVHYKVQPRTTALLQIFFSRNAEITSVLTTVAVPPDVIPLRAWRPIDANLKPRFHSHLP
jgi:hypothetical protein